MNILSKQEELILLAVWRLRNDAYGVKIRKYLIEVTGSDISIGGIYVPLDRLVRKEYLQAYQGEPTPERGGMSKRYYELTPEGAEALQEARRVHETLWASLPQLSFSSG